MADIRGLVFSHLTKYPGMQPVDLLALLYQSALGPGVGAPSEDELKTALETELATPALVTAQPRQAEPLGGQYARLYLSGLDKGPTPATLARLCALSAPREADADAGMQLLQEGLRQLRGLAGQGALPYGAPPFIDMLNRYILDGCPAPRHSERYKGLYAPHYRVVQREMGFYLPVLAAVDAALAQKPHVLLGIDGMSAAGKSGLAALLQRVYGCGVVHTDDFFLRPWQRTAQRLAEVGGNIDYERLAPVAAKAADDRAFAYRAYRCKTEALAEEREVPAARLTVLEGVYALHPGVAAQCDVRVFLAVDAGVQAQRIQARCGAALARRYAQEWIPMENRYFSEWGIRDSCRVVLDTTGLY